MTIRGIFKILMTAVLATNCATADKGGRVVDTRRNEVVIASSGDERSLIAAGKASSSTDSVQKKLEADTNKDPRDSNAMVNLAQIYMIQGKHDEAEDLAKKVLRIDMKNLEARKVLAQASVRKGQFDLAELYLANFGGTSSKDPQIINLHALIELGRGNNTAAARLFKEALKISPNDIAVRMNLGVLYLKHRQLAQASVEFERVLKVDPENMDAKLHVGIVKSARGQTDDAIAIFKSILKKDKVNQLALFNLAVAEKKRGDLDDSMDHLKAFVKYATSKSAQTDQAFALMEEINQEKTQKGEKVSDKDLESLAQDLEERKDVPATKAPAKKQANTEPAKAKPAVEAKADDSNRNEEKDQLEEMIGH